MPNETGNDFKNHVEDELKHLRETMDALKNSNQEWAKEILRMENRMITSFSSLQTQISVMDERVTGPLKEYEGLKSNVYGFLIKGAGAFIVILGGMFISMWVFINQVKTKIDSLPQGNTLIENLKAIPLKKPGS